MAMPRCVAAALASLLPLRLDPAECHVRLPPKLCRFAALAVGQADHYDCESLSARNAVAPPARQTKSAKCTLTMSAVFPIRLMMQSPFQPDHPDPPSHRRTLVAAVACRGYGNSRWSS